MDTSVEMAYQQFHKLIRFVAVKYARVFALKQEDMDDMIQDGLLLLSRVWARPISEEWKRRVFHRSLPWIIERSARLLRYGTRDSRCQVVKQVSNKIDLDMLFASTDDKVLSSIYAKELYREVSRLLRPTDRSVFNHLVGVNVMEYTGSARGWKSALATHLGITLPDVDRSIDTVRSVALSVLRRVA